MTTTKTVKLRRNWLNQIRFRAEGYYDKVVTEKFDGIANSATYEMTPYDGLHYQFKEYSGKTYIDFSETKLPFKFVDGEDFKNELDVSEYALTTGNRTFDTLFYNNFNNHGATVDYVSGDASGFFGEGYESSAKFITLPKEYKRNDDVTYYVKFTTGTFLNDGCIISAEYLFNIQLQYGNIGFYNWGNISGGTICSARANTTYWIKVHLNGTQKTYSYSTDGVNYTTLDTQTDSAMNPQMSYKFCFGVHSTALSSAFRGTIHFSETKIMKGDELIWSPQGGTALYNNFELYNQSYPLYINGNNGDVSGFSENGMINIPSSLRSNNNFEGVFCFTTPNSFASWETLVCMYWVFGLHISNGRLGIWDIGGVRDVLGSYLQYNTKYWVKVTVDSDNHIKVYLSTDGTNYNLDFEFTDSGIDLNNNEFIPCIGNDYTYDASNRYFRGVMHLGESYIKHNGVHVWNEYTTASRNFVGCLDSSVDYTGNEMTLNCFYRCITSRRGTLLDGYTYYRVRTLYLTDKNNIDQLGIGTQYNSTPDIRGFKLGTVTIPAGLTVE